MIFNYNTNSVTNHTNKDELNGIFECPCRKVCLWCQMPWQFLWNVSFGLENYGIYAYVLALQKVMFYKPNTMNLIPEKLSLLHLGQHFRFSPQAQHFLPTLEFCLAGTAFKQKKNQ